MCYIFVAKYLLLLRLVVKLPSFCCLVISLMLLKISKKTSPVKDVFKTLWESKMHGVTKIGIFCPLFCVNMLGKSTNYSTGTRPLCSTF